jgi:hypothetical protein
MGGLMAWRRCASSLGLLAALFAAPVTMAPALAAGGSGHGSDSAKSAGDRPDKETRRPRDEADLVGGRYMQLAALWLPVAQGARWRYQAITPRLVPAPGQRVMACFKAPWAHEALLFALNADPMTFERLDSLNDPGFRARLLERIHAHVGMTGLYTDIVVASGFMEPDPTEFDLSIMCQ